MAKVKPLETYKKGDKVKVDFSGSGEGYKFLTINEGFVTNNCNGYKDYNFKELPKEIKISEYYIRLLSEDDIAQKKLVKESKANSFEFDYDQVNRTFWKSQAKNIAKCINYVDKFVHPYLTRYKHILTVDKMMDWDSYYKKGMHTKSKYIYVIPHKHLNIVVFATSTYVDVIITAPENLKNPNWRRRIHIFTLAVEYADDKYQKLIVNTMKAILKNFDDAFSKEHAQDFLSYFIHPYPEYDKLDKYQHMELRGDYNDWKTMPSSQYIFVLRELNYIKHYIFNKGFE